MAYLTDTSSHLLLATDAVEHAKELFARARQQITPQDFAAIELAHSIAEQLSTSLAVLEQQMAGDLTAARKAVA